LPPPPKRPGHPGLRSRQAWALGPIRPATTLRITVLATIGFSGWKGGELPRRALEQSGFLEHSDIVLLMHSHGDDSPRAGETDFVTAKHRYRATGETATAVFVQKYGRFMDMPPGGLNG
jgi:hypothetical protein